MESGSRRLRVLTDQLNSDLQYITAGRNAKEAAKLAPGAPHTNFAQIGFCTPKRHHCPKTVEELQQLIREIVSKKERCRIVGSAKSPNSIAFTSDHMIHSDGFSRILSVDSKAMTITCEGGAIMGDLHRVLDANGLMLKCVPSIVDMTIAGALGTGTHSSGIATKSLCAYVTEMTFVNGLGEVVVLTRNDNPKELRLAACHLGALGFIVKVTLQAERRCMWRMSSNSIAVERLNSVLAQRVMTSEYYRFWYMPHTNQCYETIGRRLVAYEDDNRGETQSAAAQSTMSGATANSTTPVGKMKNILKLMKKGATEQSEYRTWLEEQNSLSHRIAAKAKGLWLKHHTLEAALLVSCYAPFMQPAINKTYRWLYMSSPEDFYGSAVDAFTFDCLFKQWANEWAIEAHRALEALDLIRQMISAHHLKVHFPIEFRFADEEDIAMSPSVGRKTCWIGLVMYRPHLHEARDTIKAYNLFCQLMQRLGGRPHWAKYFQWRAQDVSNAYGMHWQWWLHYRQQQDPQRVFVNEWLQQLMTQD